MKYVSIRRTVVFFLVALLVFSAIGISFGARNNYNGLEEENEDLNEELEQPSLGSAIGRTEYLVSLTPAPIVEEPSDLQSHAQETQDDLLSFVESNEGIDILNTFWLTNVVSLSVDTNLLSPSTILEIDHVERVYEPPEIEVIETAPVLSTESDDVSLSSDSFYSEQDYTYGLKQINVPEAWDEHNTQGEGVSVAVLSTGVDVEHPDLEVDKWAHFNSTGEPVDSDPHDGHGFGTNVSGIIVGPEEPDGDVPAYGVAPEADHWGVKVLDDDGSGTFEQVIAGMEWSVSEGADVMSMSFGASDYQDVLIDPVVNSIDAGTTVVARVGNSGEGNSETPGNIYDAIGVGASNKTEVIADFSSGEVIDTDEAWEDPLDHWPDEYIVPSVTAPGVDVLSSSAGGGYGKLSNTGMSAAYVSGVVALAQSASEEDLEPEALEEGIEQSAFKPDDWDPPAGERDTRYGSGIIDANGTIDYLVDEYTLTVNIEGEGTVTDHEDFEFQDGETKDYTEMTEVKLTTIADEHWYLVNWTGDYEGTEEEITITMDEDKEITAWFEEEYTLTVNIEGEGEVDREPDQAYYEPGTDVTLTAYPDDDYEFDEWTGDYQGEDEKIIITMDEDKSVTAHFEELDPAYFEVEITNYDDEVEEGEEATVEYKVTNTGKLEDTQNIIFNVDGEQEKVDLDITLDGNETYTGDFTWIAEEAGAYNLEIASEDDQDTVAISVVSVEEDDEEEQDTPGFTSILLLLGVIIAVVIYYKKKR